MRDLPRLPEGASCDEKIRIIYDWLYELQMDLRSSAQNDLEGAAQNSVEGGASE